MEIDIVEELKMLDMFVAPRPRMTIDKAIQEIVHLRKLKKVVPEPTPLEMPYSSSLSNDLLSPSGLVLVEQARLCCHFEIPKSLIEIDRLLWKAFDLGKKYRDAGGKE